MPVTRLHCHWQSEKSSFKLFSSFFSSFSSFFRLSSNLFFRTRTGSFGFWDLIKLEGEKLKLPFPFPRWLVRNFSLDFFCSVMRDHLIAILVVRVHLPQVGVLLVFPERGAVVGDLVASEIPRIQNWGALLVPDTYSCLTEHYSV